MKRIVLVLLSVLTILSNSVFADVYIEDMNEYIINLGEQVFDAANEPKTIDVTADRDFIISMDIYSGAKLSISDGTKNFEILQHLNNSRGAVVRENGKAVFLYDENGKKLDIGTATKNYKFYINFSTNTLELEVDGVKVKYSTVENTYTAKETCSIGISGCKSINLSDGKFGKIQAYYPPEEKETNIADAEFELWKNSLLKLGIMPDVIKNKAVEDTVTRAQFAALAANMVRINSFEGNSAFTDIKNSHTAFAAINGLNAKGYMIGYGEKFKPNDVISASEAVAVVGRILGYNKVNYKRSEDMSLYLSIKEFSDNVMDGISFVSSRQLVTMKDAVHLIYNALTAPRFDELYTTEINELLNAAPDKTVLSEHFGYEMREVIVTDVNRTVRNITVMDEDGGIATYGVDTSVSLLNTDGTKQIIWVNTDTDTVFYMMPYNFSRTLYGFIAEYNNGVTFTPVQADKISKIKMSNMSDYIKTDSDYTVMLGESVFGGSFDPTGQFVRLDIEDNKVYCINILPDVTEGGIITYVSNDKIVYNTGSAVNILELSELGDTVALLNGSEVSFDKIKTGAYFDYAVHEDTSYLLFSDASYTGILAGAAEDKLTVGDIEVNITSKTIYTSTDGGGTYSADNSLSDFLGREATVYTDMAGAVRYIKTTGSVHKYGIVLGGGEEDEDMLYVALINDNGIENKMLVYDGKTANVFYPEVSYEAALSSKKNVNGDGMYKFTIAGDKIKRIELIDWNGAMRTDGKSLSGSQGRIEADGDPKYIYLNPEAVIVSLIDENGNFNPKKWDFASISNTKTNGYSAFSYRTDKLMPMKELLVLGEGFSNLYDSTWYYGVVSQINKVYENDELAIRYVINTPIGEQIFTVPEEKELKVADSAVEKNDVILFAYNGVTTPIQAPLNTRKLSILDPNLEKYSHGTTEQTDTGAVTYTRDFYIGGTFLKEQSGFINLSGEQSESWLKKAGVFMYYILRDNGRLETATVNDIVGKEVYVATYEGMAQMVIGVER